MFLLGSLLPTSEKKDQVCQDLLTCLDPSVSVRYGPQITNGVKLKD